MVPHKAEVTKYLLFFLVSRLQKGISICFKKFQLGSYKNVKIWSADISMKTKELEHFVANVDTYRYSIFRDNTLLYELGNEMVVGISEADMYFKNGDNLFLIIDCGDGYRVAYRPSINKIEDLYIWTDLNKNALFRRIYNTLVIKLNSLTPDDAFKHKLISL